MSIILLSYTPLDSPGGVPRWNRDFVKCFPETKHFSWWDVPDIGGRTTNEWTAADTLSAWLHGMKMISKDDIIIADGFWGEKLSSLGYKVVSVAHGIWSHLTKEDVQAGKFPEFPVQHSLQVNHRRNHLARGGKIVSVSEFISYQMKEQWNFDSTVICNGIDLEEFQPFNPETTYSKWAGQRFVVHGVTSANKGYEHIDAVKKSLPNDWIEKLDTAAESMKVKKYDAMANADLAVHPSAYEGFGYFPLEAMALGVPIVAYDVGVLWNLRSQVQKQGLEHCCPGVIIDKKFRSPEETAKVTKFVLESVIREKSVYNPRQVAECFSLDRFKREWTDFLGKL